MTEELKPSAKEAQDLCVPKTAEKPPRPHYPFKEFKAEPHEEPLSVAESLVKFEEILQNTKNLIFVTDLDGTVLLFAADPRESRIDPQAKEAFQRLHQLGIPIVVMTGRGEPKEQLNWKFPERSSLAPLAGKFIKLIQPIQPEERVLFMKNF